LHIGSGVEGENRVVADVVGCLKITEKFC